MTLTDLTKEYVAVHVSKLKSADILRRSIEKYVAQLGDGALDAITKARVALWHRGIGEKYPQAANAALKQLSAMFEYALTEGYITRNPCKGVTMFSSTPRKRFLKEHELAKLNEVLETVDPFARVFVKMLLFTACRRDEARTVEWAHLDLAAKRWTKPSTKTTPHTTVLPDALVAELEMLPRRGRYVFGTRHGNPWQRSKVQEIWEVVRAKAGLDDVHIHDLRRTTETLLDQRGVSLSTIQKVLNHSNITTTQRYLVGLSVNDAVVDALNHHANTVRMK